nr:hypothetical protein [Tanacetum cinerariifolium]
MGPFKILAKVGTIAYRLKLPEQLSRVHNTFYVSNLKKYFSNEPLAILLDEIQIDDKLNFIEEPVKIKDREVKRLKQSRIPIIKVCWNSRKGPEFTWEREEQMQKQYPYLFFNSESVAAFAYLRSFSCDHIPRHLLFHFTDSRQSVPTADVYIAKKLAIVEDFTLLHEDKIYTESKTHVCLDLSKVTITLQAKGMRYSFGIQQVYLQHEHYALWEVIEFGGSYKALPEETAKDKGPAGKVSSLTKKKGRTVAITAEDMQKRKNNVKARTTLLLALPDEHQLRFSKYDSAKELRETILKTFGGNEATKKTKKNQLKQQYGNFKAERSETNF